MIGVFYRLYKKIEFLVFWRFFFNLRVVQIRVKKWGSVVQCQFRGIEGNWI